eukprot:2508690-Pyramimonas_sp.AAC.1
MAVSRKRRARLLRDRKTFPSVRGPCVLPCQYVGSGTERERSPFAEWERAPSLALMSCEGRGSRRGPRDLAN